MTTSDYLTQLQQDKADLVDNLTTQGITGLTGDETFTELVPEVLNISGSDYNVLVDTSLPYVRNTGIVCIIKNIDLIDTSNMQDFSYMFNNCRQLLSIPTIDTSRGTDMSAMFYNCANLTSIPLINTSNATSTYRMFSGCIKLVEVPLINTSNVTGMQQMFASCSDLVSVPQLNTSNVTNMTNMFNGCSSLNDTSLDNILLMCINATSYTDTKTLKQLGITSTTYYPVSRIEALPHYQDFINAGWTIGY